MSEVPLQVMAGERVGLVGQVAANPFFFITLKPRVE